MDSSVILSLFEDHGFTGSHTPSSGERLHRNTRRLKSFILLTVSFRSRRSTVGDSSAQEQQGPFEETKAAEAERHPIDIVTRRSPPAVLSNVAVRREGLAAPTGGRERLFSWWTGPGRPFGGRAPSAVRRGGHRQRSRGQRLRLLGSSRYSTLLRIAHASTQA